MSRTPRLPSAVDGAPATFATMFSHAPTLVSSFYALYSAMWRSSVATPDLKELLRIRAARKIDCNL